MEKNKSLVAVKENISEKRISPTSTNEQKLEYLTKLIQATEKNLKQEELNKKM